MADIYKCIVCGEIVSDYKPEYCCDGRNCGCMGKPLEPPICSKECYDKIFGSEQFCDNCC